MTSIMRGFHEAVITLSNWNILIETEVTGKTAERFIGLNEANGLGHLSEKIFHFDEKAKFALMETGPLYRLNGAPGRPDDKTIGILARRIGTNKASKLLENGLVGLPKFRYPLS
ncbi:hypothetical protein [Methylophaga pinxianii]|uniref:hypothetical protein n=1 Tax=Methylophaga pinxianii TaxID=2881052 RepID=UPI001CF1BE88|nr:hypothetical protein [Methylophaga pinxianii]MCB2427125.1 hypothetical protein [Methylophaga pinxianii]UPH44972.1 hypothetical protein LGT42_010670 [Methylophaga pinxianii]